MLLLVLLLVLVWTLKKPAAIRQDTPDVTEAPPSAEFTTAVAPARPNDAESPAISSKQVLIDDEPKALWLEEIENRVYSNDPVIEVVSLSTEFYKCDVIGHNHHNLLAESNVFLPQLKVAEAVRLECEALAARYPRWYHAKLREKKLLKLEPNSIAGKKLHELFSGLFSESQQFDYNRFTNDRNRLALAMKNAPLTSYAALDQVAGMFFNNESNAIYEELLNTQDGLWIHLANELALQNISCTFPNSQSCEPTSFYMVHQCQRDASACGLSFPTWYQQHISAGLKADVLILQNYYQQISHE